MVRWQIIEILVYQNLLWREKSKMGKDGEKGTLPVEEANADWVPLGGF